MVRKIVVAVLLGFLTLHIMMIPAKAASTTNSSCDDTQFSVVVKTATELKAKADQNSQTVKTYAKNKKLSVMKRSGDWYQICYGKKPLICQLKMQERYLMWRNRLFSSKLKKRKCKSSGISYRQEA